MDLSLILRDDNAILGKLQILARGSQLLQNASGHLFILGKG